MLFATMLMLVADPAAADGAAKPKPAAEKKICRRQVATSSRLDVTRTCRTRGEWDQLDRASGRSYRRDMDQSRGSSAG